jgi:hypothetical protein
LLTKQHVTHKTVDIKAYKVTDFKTEIRCGQDGVQQIVVFVVWQISVGVESCDTTQQVWLITLWVGQNGPWLAATFCYG